jgi:leucyl/phenylalanyl-tRNA--protein transferase
MIKAYRELYEAGYAHSYECWNQDNVLVGGLYGVSIGRVFFGESMFSHANYASKCCLKALIDSAQYRMIDCQMNTEHMMKMGAEDISREQFGRLLKEFTK